MRTKIVFRQNFQSNFQLIQRLKKRQKFRADKIEEKKSGRIDR